MLRWNSKKQLHAPRHADPAEITKALPQWRTFLLSGNTWAEDTKDERPYKRP